MKKIITACLVIAFMFGCAKKDEPTQPAQPITGAMEVISVNGTPIQICDYSINGSSGSFITEACSATNGCTWIKNLTDATSIRASVYPVSSEGNTYIRINVNGVFVKTSYFDAINQRAVIKYP